MPNPNGMRVRQSVRDLQVRYDNGNTKPLDDLVRAWIGIKALPPTDPKSFFVLGGYHGEPFQYRKQVDALSETDTYTYWGGYCNHGNVLFPTWHRIYVYKLEEALQSIVPGVSMPYWDEASEDSVANGIPAILTQEKYLLDGNLIDNPLRSFVLPEALLDFAAGDDNEYEKPQGYETVRYPLSGLVGSEAARQATAQHNAQFPSFEKNTQLLNSNVVAWLHGAGPKTTGPTPTDPNPTQNGIFAQFIRCLSAPNYTVFSNTTSAAEWNNTIPGLVTALEAPHNDIHLAVGGFDIPQQGESGQIADANGDMGENNTAAMDPIFFFHHCNIDRMFWVWQKQNGHTDSIDIIDGYKGTSSSDSQGPTPGIAPGTNLDLDTPLNPFMKADGTVFTSRDCINIETQLGFTYSLGSLDAEAQGTVNNVQLAQAISSGSTRKLTVSGIDRALFQGSFVLRAFATVQESNGKQTEYYLGHHSVLSRRNVVRCANCLTHLEVVASFPLSNIPEAAVNRAKFRIEIQHRGTTATPAVTSPSTLTALPMASTPLPEKLKVNFKVID